MLDIDVAGHNTPTETAANSLEADVTQLYYGVKYRYMVKVRKPAGPCLLTK